MSVGELPALRLRPDFEIQSLTLADGVLTMSMADGSRFVAPEEAVAAIARPQLPGCRMVLQIWIGPAKMPYVLLARDLPDAPTRAALSGLMDRLIARCRARLAAGEAIQGDGWILRPDAFVIADPWQPITVPRAAIAGVKLDPAGVHLISYASEAHGLLFGQGGRLLDVLGPLLGWVDTPVATRRAIRPADPLKQMPHETLSIEHTAKQISPATIAPPPPVPTAFAHPHAGASSNYNAAPSYASGSSLNAAMRAGLSGGSRSASQYAAPNAYTAPNSYAAATGYRSPVRAKPSHGVELAPGLV
ncbi:MAG TPA: hypothetical protein VGE52_22350, partial [Pirellulales bacterium]